MENEKTETQQTEEDSPSSKEFWNSIKSFLEIMPLDYLFAALVTGFCLSSFCTVLTNSPKISYMELSFVSAVNMELVIMTAVIIFIALVFFALLIRSNQVIPIALLMSCVLFGSSLAYKGSYLYEESSKNIFMNIAIGFILFFAVTWIAKDNKLDLTDIRFPKYTEWIVAGILLVIFTVWVSVASVARYTGYMSHNFDFGIFAQMFENMRTTGLPNTTVERNILMSHFGVHFSPIYYLLLPFYAVYPHPETLLVLQAIFVGAGIIPVVLIGKKLNMTQSVIIACCVLYIFFPTLSNGCLYDFHENKFLTVLIMWAVYFIVSDKWIGTVIFCLLVMGVKEDAPIYVMSMALYVLVVRKKYILGTTLFGMAVIYFVIATSIVNSLGDGIMTSRLDNYMLNPDDGFTGVIHTCVANFGYFMSQIFTADKIMFMVWMLLPVGFAPFFSEKKSMLLLLIPMLVVDLMSNWQYQYDVKFQYTFGVAGLIVFMTMMVLSQSDNKMKNTLLIYSTSMSIIMCFSLFFPRASSYIESSRSVQRATAQYNSLIATIPNDASVTANGNYIPHMYNFPNLYQYPDMYGNGNPKTDYVLVNINDVQKNSDGLADFMGDDYEFVEQKSSMALYKIKSH